jgi:hypothetical protein
MEMMRRFGVPELVPRRTQEASDVDVVGSLGVGRLGLATTTGTNVSNAFDSTLNSVSAGRQSNLEIMHSSTNTSKRPLEMEIDNSEDDKRQRT